MFGEPAGDEGMHCRDLREILTCFFIHLAIPGGVTNILNSEFLHTLSMLLVVGLRLLITEPVVNDARCWIKVVDN